jgi:hypothetical protein
MELVLSVFNVGRAVEKSRDERQRGDTNRESWAKKKINSFARDRREILQ